MAILDGNAYDAKCLEAGQERDEDLDACSLLLNNKQQALLVPSGAAGHTPSAKVLVQLTVRCLSQSHIFLGSSSVCPSCGIQRRSAAVSRAAHACAQQHGRHQVYSAAPQAGCQR